MPKFFFDVECEDAVTGQVSASLPDLETAEHYARGFADTIMGKTAEGTKAWRVSIKTERGKVIEVVTPTHD